MITGSEVEVVYLAFSFSYLFRHRKITFFGFFSCTVKERGLNNTSGGLRINTSSYMLFILNQSKLAMQFKGENCCGD